MPEFELHSIFTKGRKEVPDGTIVELRIGRAPGTVSVRVQLPLQDAWTDYPDLEIRDGIIELPVTLAFLSHAKDDSEFVSGLAARLLQDGVLTWFDENDLLPGDDWRRKIDKGIEQSDFILLFLSSSSVSKTGYFQRELKYALEQQKLRPEGARYVIPIIIDGCQPPPSLRDIHWLRLDQPRWYERLKQALLIS
ncbi:toll/interleukin-1 receptor domain-containing protein [Pelagibius sp.]|uniref:toll/interleukin-1 receptor domain-containing protein n=1 Tax=Pelagibius sp. TaxID=1931238 RepID=UPI00262D3505|nr:toll/interleukin-1 receptor domain-containing protein [Pelagibius sp.]